MTRGTRSDPEGSHAAIRPQTRRPSRADRTVANIAATIGFALQIGARIDGTNQRIDSLGARLDSRIDALGETFIRHDHGTRP